MTVLLVVRASEGGMRRHVLSLSRQLAARGIRVVLAAPRDPATERATPAAGWRLQPIAYGRIPGPDDLRSVGIVRRLALTADVVHAHGLRAGLLLRFGGMPYVYTLHGFPRSPLACVLERIVLRGAQGVLSVSAALDGYAGRAGVGADRRRVVPGSVDAEAIAGAKPATVFSEGAIPRIGYLGRLSREKGVDVLLKAFSLLLRELPEGELAVAGDGPLRARLEAQARTLAPGHVLFLGRVEDAPAFLRAVEIYAQPSRREGQGLAALEALAAGCRVVASDVGGLRENLFGDAVLVPAGDPSELSRALVRAAARPAAPGGGLRRAREFTADRQAEETLQAYRAFVHAVDFIGL